MKTIRGRCGYLEQLVPKTLPVTARQIFRPTKYHPAGDACQEYRLVTNRFLEIADSLVMTFLFVFMNLYTYLSINVI